VDEKLENQIAADAGAKIIRDKVLGSFKLGQLVHIVLTWNENIEKEIKSAKKEVLLASYFEKNEKNEIAIEQLKKLLTDAQGNTLFNKIVRILDNSPPDLELTDHLAGALKHISETRFRELFEQHRYALEVVPVV
jgi:uncharacterized protein YqfB (UPF0267 family)